MSRSYLRRGLFLLATVFGIAFMSALPVAAFNNFFPDNGDTSGNANIMLVSQTTQYVKNTDSKVRIWFPSKGTRNVTIYNGHFCNSNAFDYLEAGSWPTGTTYANAPNYTKFTASSSTGYNDVKHGKGFANGQGECNDTLVFTVTDADYGPNNLANNGYYWIDINIEDVGPNGAVNYFRIVAEAQPGVKIGLPEGGSGYSTTQEQTDTSPANLTYNVPFGTPCDNTAGETATVSLYDIDNNGGSGAQKNGKVTVAIYNISDGNYVKMWSGTGSFNAADNVWTPGDGGNVTQYVRFTALPLKKYRLELRNVYYNNTIQYSIPYKQIFRENCPPPPPAANITPTVGLAPTPIIEAGEAYTATASFQNTSPTAGNVTTTWRTWMDNDQTYGNGGESNVTTRAVDAMVGGNSTYTVSPNVTGTADGAKTWVCTEIFGLTSSGSNPAGAGVNFQPGTRKACVAIGKAPGFSVERADVRAGGRFVGVGATSCTVALPAYPLDANFAPIRGHNYPNTKSSLVEHGILTPGRITEIKKTFASDSSLRFGTSAWAAPDGRYLGNAAQASAETHCLPDVAGLYGKFATPYTNVLPLNATSSGEYEMDGAGPETLTVCLGGCVLGPNSQVVIRATKPTGVGGVKTVRIAGNITYAGGPYASVDAIPRFVLIADPGIDMEIAAGVTEVNGIISAGNKLRTCDGREGGPSASMTVSDCAQPLFMRAVVITEGRIYPFRTAGFSSASDNTFAEVFRVAPGLVLADYARAKKASVMTTQHMSELPPRF